MRFLYGFLVASAGLVIVIAVLFYIDVRHDQKHVPRGVSIAGLIDVGGMTYDEAFEKVDTLLSYARTGTRTLISDQNIMGEKTFDLAELRPTIVREELIGSMHIFETGGTPLQRAQLWLRMWFGDTYDITPVIRWESDPQALFISALAEVDKKTKHAPMISTPASLMYSLEQSLFVRHPAHLVIASDRVLNSDPSFSIPQKIFVTGDGDNMYSSVLTHDQLYALLLPDEHDGWFINIELLRMIVPSVEVTNAQFDTSDPERVHIIPSRAGIALDYISMSNDLVKELILGRTHVRVHYTRIVEPTFTTEQAEALGIKHMISSFTTYYPAGAVRVHNIQLMADLVNNAIVAPGSQFNLNAYVGKRTPSKGFKKAGMIFNGELVDDFGGGVSQFATTLYNAIFWGGLKDIKHKAHSWYFSRYPEGIEATVSWPDVDLIFENDYSSSILIQTAYTDNSITVKVYGDNDGRIVTGEQSGGKTTTTILDPGGELARQVAGGVSSRSNFKEPGIKYLLDTEKKEFSSPDEHGTGKRGWTVTAWRTISKPARLEDGTLVITEEKSSWPVVYLPEPYVLYVHSCVLSGEAPNTFIPLQNCAPPVVRN